MPTSRPIQIKICGITSAADALMAANAGADAIGLNFWPQSRRFVRAEAGAEIAAVVPSTVMKVGVFVNALAEELASTVDQVGLDWIQLHGDEPPELLAELPARVLILKVIRCGSDGIAPVARFLTTSHAQGRGPDAILVDADAANDFGGTGRCADWERIARERNLLSGLPLILAGGLTPQNVVAAITAVRPDGVDVASGVESQPGRKDRKLVSEFIAAGRAGFASL